MPLSTETQIYLAGDLREIIHLCHQAHLRLLKCTAAVLGHPSFLWRKFLMDLLVTFCKTYHAYETKPCRFFEGSLKLRPHTCCYLSPSSLQCRVQIKAADIAAIALTGSCPIPLASEFKGYSSIPLQGCTPCIWHAQNKPNHLLLPSSRGLFGVTCSLPAGFDDSAPALEMDTVLLACGVYVSTQ